jgi:HPt (histidine-containing phosphotransfer) domain-containing protein
MPESKVVERENGNGAALSFRNGKEQALLIPKENRYAVFSTLKQLPGVTTVVGTGVLGEELGRLFTEQPELPGVILYADDRFVGVISQSHYYKCISRAFGREVYHRRPCVIMLDGVTVKALVLKSETLIHDAVEQCLVRPADYVYEPFLVHDLETGQYRLCAFQTLLLASAQLATLRNRQMEQILNSVTDGLLVIDRDFRIGGEYSRVVGNIFERSDLRDASLPEVLQPILDSVIHEQLQDYLRILFDPKLIDRLIKSINPARQISAHFPADEFSPEKRIKHFSLDFERIRTQTEISQVLVRIEDITQRMNFARELEQQEAASERKLHLVMQILQVEPGDLNRFLDRFDKLLSNLSEIARVPEGPAAPRDTIHSLFRLVHTLKGEASLLRLAVHEEELHRLEDHLEKLRSHPQLEASDFASVEPYHESLQDLSDQIGEALNQLKYLGTTTRAASAKAPTTSGAAGPTAPAGLIDALSRWITDLSGRLGKPASFHTAVREEDVPTQHREILHEMLIHLARNSMVHGIEPPDDRMARGKAAAGLIQLDLKSHAEFHEIIFQDDGRGLDYDRIRRRAARLGWKLESEEELRQAIFEPGFSTAENITDLAGRGVGLDVIRSGLAAVGGHIIPHSQPGAYCAFQILLPKTPPARAA